MENANIKESITKNGLNHQQAVNLARKERDTVLIKKMGEHNVAWSEYVNLNLLMMRQ